MTEKEMWIWNFLSASDILDRCIIDVDKIAEDRELCIALIEISKWVTDNYEPKQKKQKKQRKQK